MLLPCFLLLFASPADAQPPISKIGDELLSAFSARNGEVRYFIRLGDKADLSKVDKSLPKHEKGALVYHILKNHAEKTQAALIGFLESRRIRYQRYHLVNAVLVSTDFVNALEIARLGEVERLVHDPVLRQAVDPVKEQDHDRGSGEPEWGILGIGADQVWDMGYEGAGAVIGGADTGVEWIHSTIREQYRGFSGDTVIHDYHWFDAIHEISPLHGDTTDDASLNPCGLEAQEPCDDNNHGTHTVGTMVGRDSANLIGIAPAAKWMACRNMERGWGSPSTYIECFEWFLAPTNLDGENPDPAAAPDVINNSWRCPEIEGCNESNFGLIQDAVRALKQAGIFVVVSAGNDGPGCFSIDAPPAIFEESFSVGAHASNDTIAGFSSRGPIPLDSGYQVKPDIAAPGVSVRSAIRNQGFARFSGTSMAGPHVAGTVALMISANPELRGQVDAIADLLVSTATPVPAGQDCAGAHGTHVPNNTYGHGLLNAHKAVQAGLNFTVRTDQVVISNAVSLYPNPARAGLNWKTDGEVITHYRIHQLNGHIIRQGRTAQASTGQIDLSACAPGLYIIHLQGVDRTFVGKFSVAR